MYVTMFKAIDWFMDDPLEIIETKYDNIQKMEKQGIAFSVFDNEGCLGCGGYLQWEENLAEAWLRLDKRALEYPVKAIHIIREGYRILSDVYKGEVYCWVDEDWPKAQRLVKWFGFVEADGYKTITNKVYRMWELKDGNYSNDSRVSCKRDGSSTTGQHDEATGRSPSTNIRI
jgi:hypothetical protein